LIRLGLDLIGKCFSILLMSCVEHLIISGWVIIYH
jgi:hypothetical protein